MGAMVEFPSNVATGGGYLAPANEGAGLGVVVIHDRRGIVDHIVDVCDRFATEGFTAVAPDVYHGETVPRDDAEEAAKAEMAMDPERNARDLSGTVDYLQAHDAVRGHGVAVVGFGTGGGVALWLATLRPEAVRAAVPFYGIAREGADPDWSAMTAAVEGHFADYDDRASPEAVAAFVSTLSELGKEVRAFNYPGTGHGFFDDTRPDVYDEDAARQAWVRTLEFLRAKLG